MIPSPGGKLAAMDRRRVITAVAAARCAAGTAFLVAPRLAGMAFAGSSASSPAAVVLARALGIRDLLIGVGALRAVAKGDDPGDWLLYGAASDTVDALALTAAAPKLGRLRLVLAGVAGGAAITQLALRATTPAR